jgi:DNA polymerase III delta prime subunit
MARFTKAKAQQARIKMMLYGPPGSGKTFTALLMAEGLAKVRGKRIAMVDTERGSDFYVQPVKQRLVHPEAFDIDALYTRSIADVTDAVKSLSPKEHGVVIIDSISHLWDAAMEAYTGKKTRVDSIPMHAWSKIKRPYKDLVSYLIGSPLDVFILARQKNLFDTDDDSGEMKKIGVGARAESDTAYEPQSIYVALVEKDRTGVLAGRALKNPGFRTIEPLLPLLGEVQAPSEDADERAAKDGDLLDKLDERSQAKEDKSRELTAAFQTGLLGASTPTELATVADDIAKHKRYLVEDHQKALRITYEERRAKLVPERLL